MFDEYKEHDYAIYAGYLTDKAKLVKSTSGGIASALTEHMIDQGGYVAGVIYSKDFYNAEYILTQDKSDIDRLKGSKYIDSNKKGIFIQVKKLLDSGSKVLFIGLPCTIGALYSYIGTRPDNLITCELICHGPTTIQVHREYISYLEKKHKAKITSFSVRYKKEAWQPPYLRATFDNGELFEKPFYSTEYGYAFSILGRESCYQCKYKGNNRKGDIMLGDFWGATENDEFWNKHGVSSVFAETEKGDAFIKSVPGIKLFSTTFDRAVEKNQMVIKPKTKHNNLDKFANLLSRKGLIYAFKHSIPIKRRIVRTISKLIPVKIKRIIKK